MAGRTCSSRRDRCGGYPALRVSAGMSLECAAGCSAPDSLIDSRSHTPRTVLRISARSADPAIVRSLPLPKRRYPPGEHLPRGHFRVRRRFTWPPLYSLSRVTLPRHCACQCRAGPPGPARHGYPFAYCPGFQKMRPLQLPVPPRAAPVCIWSWKDSGPAGGWCRV